MRNEDRLLIASAVEGSLPDADAARLRVLLAESNEAATLYRQLVSDRDRLFRLRKRSAPSRIARNVAAHIESNTAPVTVYTRPAAKRQNWLPYFIAASVALAVVGGSFFFFNENPVAKNHPNIKTPASKNANDVKNLNHGEEVASSRETLPAPEEFNARKANDAVAQSNTNTNPPQTVEKSKAIEESPKFLGAPTSSSIPELEIATAKLPLLLNLAEVGQDDNQKRILAELNRLPAVRIDLFARDLPKSIELVQSVFRSSGHQLSVSGKLQDQLKLKVPMAVAVVTESCSAAELSTMIQKLSTADAKPASMTRMHIFSASTADSRELKVLLGTDIGLWKRPQNDSGKPISDGTLGQIANAIKKDTKPAIMLTSAPLSLRIPPALLPEVKQFLERRGVRSPTDVPAIFVIRTAN